MTYVKEGTLRALQFPGLTFQSLIHFEFIFVYGVRRCSSFNFFHVAAEDAMALHSNTCLENPVDGAAW